MKTLLASLLNASVVSVLLLVLAGPRSEAQNYSWYHAFGGIVFQDPAHISMDQYGNFYLTGIFHSPIFNAGPLNVTCGGSYNFFVLKLDPAGNPVLLRKGYTGGFLSKRLHADSEENFYLVATYLGQPFLIKNQPLPYCTWGGESGLIVKFNAQGQIKWHKSLFCNEFLESMIAHVVAGDNDIVVAGSGFDSLQCQLTNQTKWVYQLNIRSLDSLGNTKWYHTIHSPQTSHSARIQFRQIHVGPDNHIYIAGLKQYDTLLLNGLFFDASPYRNFILRLDTSGNIVSHFYIQSNDDFEVRDVVVEGDGSLYLAGSFLAKVFQLPGMPPFVNTDTVTPNLELFLAKFSPQGNPVWVHTMQSITHPERPKIITNVHLDDAGNVYLSGDLPGQILNLSSGLSLSNNNPPGVNVFLLKYDSTGNLVYHLMSTVSTQAIWYPFSRFVVAGNDDLVFASATIPGHGLFGGVTVSGYGGEADVFVGRFSMITDVPIREREDVSVNLYPNPASDKLIVEIGPGESFSPYKIRILDIHGREVDSQNRPPKETRTVFSCKHFSPGVYLLHVSGNHVDIMRKFIVSK